MIHLGAFRNDVKDLISSYWTGKLSTHYPDEYPGLLNDKIMTYKNIPKATLQGIELYGNHKIAKDIYLNAGYTFLDAKDKDNNTRLTDRVLFRQSFSEISPALSPVSIILIIDWFLFPYEFKLLLSSGINEQRRL